MAVVVHPPSQDYDSRDDQHLLALVQTRRDSQALLALYRRYSTRVFSLILRIVKDRELGEEVLQDVFLRLWERSGQYCPDRGLLLSWLFTIARNLSLDRLRKESRQADFFVFLDGKDAELDEAVVAAGGHLADPESSTAIRQALETLPEAQRQALELAYFEGLTHVEIAARSGESLGTVKTRIRLGLNKMREIVHQWMLLI